MTDGIKDGGAAFPTFAPGSEAHDPGSIFEEGMKLRDYFAGQIVAGIAANLTEDQVHSLAEGITVGRFIVGASYALADAMLAERNKAQEGE